MLLCMMRTLTATYKTISPAPVHCTGKKVSTNKTDQGLISNMIARPVVYEIISILAWYGIDPERIGVCKEWNARIVELWKVLSNKTNNIQLNSSHKATMDELKSALPQSTRSIILIDKITGASRLRLSLVNYMALVLHYHLKLPSSKFSRHLFEGGYIGKSDGKETDYDDNLYMMDSKRGTKDNPASIHPTGAFSAFSVATDLLQSNRIVSTLAMAITFSAMTRGEEITSTFLVDIDEEYTEYDKEKDSANDKLPLFKVEIPESDTNDKGDGEGENTTKSPKKSIFMADLARDALVDTISDFQTAPETDISEGFKKKLSERVLTICEAITFGKHATIEDAKGSLQEKITLPPEFQPNQLAKFINAVIDLSNNELSIESRITKYDVTKCLNNGLKKKTTVDKIPDEEEHNLHRYMLLIPGRVFIHLHKYFFKGKGPTKLIKDPSIWIKRLEEVFTKIQNSDNWISTFGNTKQTIHKITQPQSVFICHRDFLTAMGVSREYQSKLTKELLNKDKKNKKKKANSDNGDDKTTKQQAQTGAKG